MRTKITAPAVAAGAGLLAGTLFATPAGATVTPVAAPQAASQSIAATTQTAGLQYRPCPRHRGCHRGWHRWHRWNNWDRWDRWDRWDNGGRWNNWSNWNSWNDWGW
ncbi:hypothetical protein AB0D67_05100 [Streptosporangium sp. NPDC048047]|uniref:hypothetical protein n=1 Tax=Streptosporangium sp. NPDC048047 TaxID=3155748 RepID=UPI00341F3432